MKEYQEQMLQALQKLISIPSIKYDGLREEEYIQAEGAPFGKHIGEALEYVLSLCGRLGFRTKNCNGFAGYAEWGEGEEMMVILTHVDVVPEGKDWDYPPFGGEIHGGKIYGRGAIDDKGPAIAAIYALKAAADRGHPFKKRVRLIFGGDEEKTWKDMDYYKKHEEQPSFGFAADANFPAVYCEKELVHCDLVKYLDGTGELWSVEGGNANNSVPDSCRARWEDREGQVHSMEETGVSAHGSRPEEGDNAVTKLLEKLYHAAGENTKAALPDGLRELAAFYDDCIGRELDGSSIGLGFRDEVSGRTTFNVGKIRANEKECRLSVDIRLPVSVTGKEAMKRMKERIEGYGYSIEHVVNFPAVYMDRDDPFLKTLMEVYKEYTEDDSEPILMGGGTYARAMKNVVAFGPRFPGREVTEHQKNEYISVEDFMKCAQIYRAAIEKMVL